MLHEYPEVQVKTKFIKSVDEGTFSKMKGGNSATVKERERGSSLHTIEHVGASQLKPFGQNELTNSHVRSSTITTNPKSSAIRNDLINS